MPGMSPFETIACGCHRRGMRITWTILFAICVLIHHSSAVCTLDKLQCCLTPFQKIISPSGLDLSVESLASACTVKTETLECMDVFIDQCINGTTDYDVEQSVNKTSEFLIASACPITSPFVESVLTYQLCIASASVKFQHCYNQSKLPDEDGTKNRDCCSYKAVRNCAVQIVEKECGAVGSQLVHEEVESINGFVMEWFCQDVFDKCGNSATVLASLTFFVLPAVVFAMWLF